MEEKIKKLLKNKIDSKISYRKLAIMLDEKDYTKIQKLLNNKIKRCDYQLILKLENFFKQNNNE